MNIIFIDKEKYIKKIIKDQKNKEYLFIALNDKVYSSLKNKGVYYKKLEEYSTKEDLNKKTINWIKEFPNQKIKDNKNFKEYFVYKNISLWWMMEFYLYESTIFYESFNDVMINTEKILRIVEKEKPHRIILIDDGNLESSIIKAVAKSKNVKVVKIKNNFNKLIKRVKEKIVPTLFLNYKILRFLMRKGYWGFLSIFNKKRKNDGKKKILLFSEYVWGETIDSVTGKKKIDDLRFTNLISEFRKENEYNIVVSDVPIGFQLGTKYFTKRLNKYAEYHPFEKYIKLRDFLSIRKDKKMLLNKWNFAKKKSLFVYEDVNLRKILEPKISFFFERYIDEMFLFFKAIDREIKIEKPSIVVLSCEVTPFGRIATALGKNNRLKVTVIQHGALSEDVDTLKNKEDISKDNDVKVPYCPIPDVSFVYGNFQKNLLVNKGNYKKEWIIPVGNIRYDTIKHYGEIYDKYKLYSLYGFNKSKKLILLSSVPFYKDSDQIDFLKTVYKSVKEFDVNFMIKIHPNEKNIKIHKVLARKIKLKNFRIVKDVDFNELLYCCDLVITAYSTSAIDAQAFGKPTIVVDLTKKNIYSQSLIKSKAVLGASNVKETFKGVNTTFNDKKFMEELIKHREQFISHYLYRIDGGASKRILEHIKKLI